jgi:D-alanyl-D-alanine carboxypeptidase/D-alanyl-D-alanine-endopeptidase (penicillin-binding protein 4)
MRRLAPFSQPEHRFGDRVTLASVLRHGPTRRLVAFAVAIVALALPAGASASLSSALNHQMRAAGPYSGAYVVDATTGAPLFAWKAGTSRVLASNVKLFTTAAALARFGVDGTFETQVVTDGEINPDGVLTGDLWLRGGGDPAFGTLAYVRKHYGAAAGSVEDLVDQLAQLGLTAVRGGVHGDESLFDTIRGVHDSGYSLSRWVGPLSALSFNHAYDGNGFQANPAAYAASWLRKTLKADAITPGHTAATSPAPTAATVLATVESPPMATLVQLTNKDSDNFFAETLLKNLGREASGVGSTSAGVHAVRSFAADAGARIQLIDGSGLDRGDRASPRDVVSLLLSERKLPEFPALFDSLPIAGVDGTIHDRMRTAPARRNCRAKTGSLIGVSALSGYCGTRSGHDVAFSFLMNGISVSYARRLQDRMAQAIAGWGG